MATWFGKIAQGLAAALADAWPVKMTDGTDVLGMPAHPVRVDPTGGTPQPVTVAVLPLPTGAGTEATLTAVKSKTDNIPPLGQALAAASAPVVLASNQPAVPVSATSLPLPAGAATEATAAGIKSGTDRIPLPGQAHMAASLPVVLPDNQSPIAMKPSDGIWNDAFGRLRVSQNNILFGSSFRFDLLPQVYEPILVGAGAVTRVPNEACARLAVSGAGDASAMQSTDYIMYRPGQGQQVVLTGVFGATPVAGVVKRLGLFDVQNGLYFQQDSTGVSVVRRTFVSGAAVNTVVTQSAWNYDKLDGVGPSGLLVDWSKGQIFVIDFQWLGMGRVRYGIDIGGVVVPVHIMNHANVLPTVYMTTASLPVRAEIATTGPAASLDFVCAAVNREGGVEEATYQGAVSTQAVGTSGQAVSTTMSTMLAIRLRASHIRASLAAEYVDIQNTGTTNPLYWELVLYSGATALAPWVSAGTAIEATTNLLTTVPATGGTVIAAGVVQQSTTQSRTAGGRTLRDSLMKAHATAAGVAEILVLRAKTASGSTTAHFVLGFTEQY